MQTASANDPRPLILVTGSSGLIGTRVVDDLARDHRVVGMDVEAPDRLSPHASFIACDLTDDGSLRSSVPIRVGNWQLDVTDRTPARGQELTLRARLTEPMAGARLEIKQPGHGPRALGMKKLDAHRAVITFSVAKRGKLGTLQLAVTVTDTGGQRETRELGLKLH